ncbi:hypothetical protein M8C21_030207 [Ambrosia artemisiifolia]|uniref:Uncharacterized protein n=1 Tax=Ambrosia artemisiifolia TaxID=4212 RepID=A0AAD5CFZ1_AMBAR|nr:hypothetical protein M8C21_030207 [Ambrosia artemisiifolia]
MLYLLLEDTFDTDVENSNVSQVIDSYMATTWRGQRDKLHDHIKEIGGSDDPTRAKTTPPSNIMKEDWEYLCDTWSDKKNT